MALPKPVWTRHDLKLAEEVDRNPSSLKWNTWNNDPTIIAILRAMVSCHDRLGHTDYFCHDMIDALTQRNVCSHFGSEGSALLNSFQRILAPTYIFRFLSGQPDFWRPPVDNVGNHEAS